MHYQYQLGRDEQTLWPKSGSGEQTPWPSSGSGEQTLWPSLIGLSHRLWRDHLNFLKVGRARINLQAHERDEREAYEHDAVERAAYDENVSLPFLGVEGSVEAELAPPTQLTAAEVLFAREAIPNVEDGFRDFLQEAAIHEEDGDLAASRRRRR